MFTTSWILEQTPIATGSRLVHVVHTKQGASAIRESLMAAKGIIHKKMKTDLFASSHYANGGAKGSWIHKMIRSDHEDGPGQQHSL